MSYFTRSQIETEIYSGDLAAMLDDDGDDTEDTGLYTALATRAEARVNAILQRRYSLPFATVPLAVAEAAIYALCASLYRRRGTTDEQNPFAERETAALDHLRACAAGDADLSIDLDATGGPSQIDGEDNDPEDDLDWHPINQEGL